jgi:aspartyl-tRNA(Asn)/glutamyl-tRNA(Gln) amidotransferase subunit A
MSASSANPGVSIAEHVAAVKAGKVDVIKIVDKALTSAKKLASSNHYLNAIADERCRAEAEEVAERAKAGKAGRLAGVLISVKDCLCVKDVETTAGSDILRGYKPVFDAAAVERVVAEGGIILGKTAQDEFGFGGFSVNVGRGFSKPLNPVDPKRSCGGSSGGAAGLTAKADFPHLAIAESTGGSIVCPAAFCGVVGLCPTYGRVSRWGLIDYANSLDKIGSMAKTVDDAALLLEIMAGHDDRDSTSADAKTAKPFKLADAPKSVKGMCIGVIKEAFGEGVDPAVAKSVKDAVKKLESQGAVIKEISLPLNAKYGVPCYYLIAMCEASTNLAKYCGMRYGAHETLEGDFNAYFTKVRTLHFGDEAKRRLMVGTFARMAGYRDAYYMRALRVRTMLINEYKKAFKQCDLLVSPTMPMVAPTFDEIAKLTPVQNYMADILTVGPNLAGLPHMTVPVSLVKGMPVGCQLIADHFNEVALVAGGRSLQ